MSLRNQNTDINNFIRNATNTQGFASAFGLEVPETLVPVLITNPTSFPIIVSSVAAPTLSAPIGATAPTSQTCVYKSSIAAVNMAAGVESAAIISYTVPVGKTFYLTDFCFTYPESAGGMNMVMKLYSGAICVGCLATRPDVGIGPNAGPAMQSWKTPIEIVAGTIITAKVTASGNDNRSLFVSFSGFVQ